MSQSFTDTKQRKWELALDPWLITQVNDKTKVLLTKWGDDDFKLAKELTKDENIGELVNVLWVLCEEQAVANGCAKAAEEANVPIEREFAKGLGRNTLFDAYTALVGAVADFRSSPEEQEALRLAVEKAKEVEKLTNQGLLEKVKERIQGIDSSQLAKSFIDSALNGQPFLASAPSQEESHSAS